MAKTPNRSAKQGPTRVQKKTKAATKAGFESVDAWTSAKRQYGVGITQDILANTMASQGLNQGQPVNIGGARWYFNGNEATYTGERSDSAKRNPGAAYNAGDAEQTAYRTGSLKDHGTSTAGVTNASIASSANGAASQLTAADAAAKAASIYAEGDISRTGTAASQGKAWEAIFGTDAGTVLGATSVPSVAQESAGEAEGGTGGGGGGKHPGKKLTRKAKSKSSPGGKKVTPRERKAIQKAKGK